MAFIGRDKERGILTQLFESDKSEFLALYGRRRVGKTYLIREFFKGKFTFYVSGATGEPGTGLREQLDNFADALSDYGYGDTLGLENWAQAFRCLKELIESKQNDTKKVLFIDEMPWLDTPRSKFISALDYFWNSFASARKDVLLIACGSAASWMTDKILNNKGGLHNRVTMRMRLAPFTLSECEQYYSAAGIAMNRYQMVESYMIVGGVPYYLSLMDAKMSLAQNIDTLFFGDSPLLKDEFSVLYHSLFKSAEIHTKIVEALSTKATGLTRKEIEKQTKLSNGGSLTRALTELELSGFIRKYSSFPRKERGAVYQLTDPYTLFYFNFIIDNNDPHFWQRYSITPSHAAWTGYAFELVCLIHVDRIKEKIGANNVLANVWAWKSVRQKPGAQIDLVIDRGDGIIDLCEMKYLNAEFSIDSAYASALIKKRSAFLAETRTKKTLHTVLVTTYGLMRNKHSSEIQALVLMDDLFE
jgi:AAA+ ATPase superfamily predicted ATPase